MQSESESIPKDTAKTMLSHMHKMHVCITAQLASTMLTFEQITNLSPGDILLLDKRVDEPVELIMDGRVFFRAQPAKSTGQYAVAITESIGHNQTQIQP
jgi:flagellar motor switch protein FliM